ncbi:MAG: CopD family protein [Deltaproteobacteria bacterium]|nr:CopD family protein [Deltaproteobacteria bacterium]
MSSLYRWFLAVHLIAVISWMAGILYLWRLFVYHVEAKEQIVKDTLSVMERKLYRFITMPAMTVAFILGVSMIVYNPNLLNYHWMRGKLALAFFMIGITHMAGAVHKKLIKGECKFSSKTLRILNEVPTLLMIGIILLAILQPF